jgi:CxxC-x17-CxxC domain-containing protein
MSTDAQLTCIDCGEIFLFTVQDQKYYLEHNYTTPLRCRPCRRKHKEEKEARERAERGETPELDEESSPDSKPAGELVRCSGCGRPTTVPFIPRNDKPIFCRDCYLASRPANDPNQGATGTTVTCTQCGQPTTVPFVPRNDKPIYCRACFIARRNGSLASVAGG